MHFKAITTQLYDQHKGDYDVKVNVKILLKWILEGSWTSMRAG